MDLGGSSEPRVMWDPYPDKGNGNFGGRPLRCGFSTNFLTTCYQEERRAKARRCRDEEMEQYRRDRELDEVEEAQFQSYARDVIQHCEQRGRNTYPLRRAAAAAAASRQVS